MQEHHPSLSRPVNRECISNIENRIGWVSIINAVAMILYLLFNVYVSGINVSNCFETTESTRIYYNRPRTYHRDVKELLVEWYRYRKFIVNLSLNVRLKHKRLLSLMRRNLIGIRTTVVVTERRENLSGMLVITQMAISYRNEFYNFSSPLAVLK